MTPLKAPILSADFRYTRSSETNVAQTWAKHGWTPPDPQKQRQMMLRLNPITPEKEAPQCQKH